MNPLNSIKLYPATVNKNDANSKNGLIQVKIPHLMDEVKEDLLPWASPFYASGGGSNKHGISFIPEVDSQVWVFFLDDIYYRNCFYIADMNFDEKHPHELYENNVAEKVGASSNYPDVKYIYLKNGISIGISSDEANPEITIYHPKAYIFIDKNGYTYYKDTYDNRIKIYNEGLVIKDTNNNEIKSDGTKWVLNNHLTVEQ